MLNYVVAEHKGYPGDWHVEAGDRNGRVYIAVFSGQDAKDRAAEYAHWKSTASVLVTQHDSEPHLVAALSY